ncbi:tetratricopeptide repeat protein [Shewanella waksmanii]|uniref:tetratricopeptide repeat protein n=1 Tax=Shewanella waksmanii TaxID=213783 RepID=UPI00048BCA1D|nr:tetratricopeptide repeat protein [Shewanella waksmanii]
MLLTLNHPGSLLSCSLLRNLAAVLLLCMLISSPLSLHAAANKPDPLQQLKISAYDGAAKGYVDDKACATCHAKLFESYQDVGMARSFAAPADAVLMERFGEEYYHAESSRYYRIDNQDRELIFHRYQKDDQGNRINHFSVGIDWILGSGYRARSYLYQNDAGELYMLPLGWYAQTQQWAMSPGFETKHHFGVQRQVKRECMFCHNAYPDVEAKSDSPFAAHLFPEQLPQGTGCQRCHGPGANHIRAALNAQPISKIHGNIINPAKLAPEQRDSVCFQCHMLPAVSMVGVRDFDSPTYSFRAGDKLNDYLAHVEVTQANADKKQHFEINHHGYRFWQSECYQQSQGQLACISCHDPHVKPQSQAFRAQVSQTCQQCHQGIEAKHPAISELKHISVSTDCVSCHMPTTRTQDVINVTMTDHKISRGPFDLNALIAPINKQDPIITDINLLPFGEVATGVNAQLIRATTVLRTKANADAADALKHLLVKHQIDSFVPYVDLLAAEVKLERYQAAINTAKHILNQPNAPQFTTLSYLGIALLAEGQTEQAIKVLSHAITLEDDPKNNYNLGIALFNQQQYTAAKTQFERTIELRPTMHSAWLFLGKVHQQQGQVASAIAAFKQALAIAPDFEKAYTELVQLLIKQQQLSEAKRYLQLGLKSAQSTTKLQALQDSL